MPHIPHADYNSAAAGYWEWTVGASQINVQPSLKTLLGYEPEELENISDWRALLPAGHLELLYDKYNAHIQSHGETPLMLEVALKHRDQEHSVCLLVTGRIYSWDNGQPLQLNGSYVDISAHINAEKELHRVRDFLFKTNQTARVGGWELDLLTGKIIWTAVTKMIFEVSEDYIPEREQIAGFFREGPDRKKLIDAVAKAITKGKDYDLELRVVTAKGRELWTRTVGHPEFENGRCVRLYGVFQDIDERKNNERALALQQRQLEAATAAKLEFLSVVSHEIRTPMNAIIGFTNLLLENAREDQLEYLKVLKFSGDNLLMLINDILDFSKISAGKISFEEITFDLSELLDNIRSAQQQDADKKDLILMTSIDPGIPVQLKGDPVRLAQIINNLVANAIKFTPDGSVELIVRLLAKNTEQVKLYFEVRDTGIGIPANKIGQIFEKFVQASSETTRKYGGTGLGLAICSRLLELVGSKLSVHSTEHEGSSFFFKLVFQTIGTEKAEPVQGTSGQLAVFPGKKILIADDNPINVMLVRKLLQQWQIAFDVAENGKIALGKVQENDYDLVLMDLQMPEMDGYDAAIAIRKLSGKQYQELPIIALTASTIADMKEKIFLAGMNECVTKPFKTEDLHGIIAHYLSKSSATVEQNART